MNVGVVTSFAVGGLLLITMLTLNNRVYESSQETTLNMMAKNNLNTVAQLITNDFQRIGYNYGGALPSVANADSTRIQFRGDMHEGDNFNSTTNIWEWDTGDPVTNTSNPNDSYLKRTGPVNQNNMGVIEIPVVHFEVIPYDANNNAFPALKQLIKRIEVEVICESPEPSGTLANGDPYYMRVVWKKTFY
ncbi:MAG: hypothetical protein R3211_07930, partial [Balneolaceae bacterium]|nr:hypothetical protein [Balneolaceae bacterium]